jgi:hypothetical protein
MRLALGSSISRFLVSRGRLQPTLRSLICVNAKLRENRSSAIMEEVSYEETPMRKLALVLAAAATLAVTAVATPSPAHARYYGYRYGPGIVGGLIAGALIVLLQAPTGMDRGMATTAVIIPDITADTIPRIMGVTIPDITAVTSTGGLITATGTFTRPDTPTTTAVPVIMAAGIAVGIAGNPA